MKYIPLNKCRKKMLYTGLALFLISSATTANQNGLDSKINDVEGIKAPMLTPDYWQAKQTTPHQKILSEQQIAEQNRRLFQQNKHMIELQNLPAKIAKTELIELIESVSKVPTSERFYENRKLISKADYSGYLQALDLDKITTTNKAQFGIVVRRTNLRTFPTNDKVFKTDDNINLDRFQETALFPAQAVAIYHQSLDKHWLFVSAYNYSAWVLKKDIAIAEREVVFDYINSAPFMVVTGDKVNTTFNPHNSEVSEVQLDMGVRLPLIENSARPVQLGGQNTYASHVVNLPTTDANGMLKLQPALIAKSKDVNIGYLEYTAHNVIQQSFKFLGERYGWGHSFNARDCTGFVGEIYKSFGILMPRNSGQQGLSQQGENTPFKPPTSTQQKLQAINQLDVGSLIYLPGHVMMYIGSDNQQPYVIHDVAGYSYFNEQGEYYKSQLNGVSVTPLKPLQLNEKTSYLDRIYNLKKIK